MLLLLQVKILNSLQGTQILKKTKLLVNKPSVFQSAADRLNRTDSKHNWCSKAYHQHILPLADSSTGVVPGFSRFEAKLPDQPSEASTKASGYRKDGESKFFGARRAPTIMDFNSTTLEHVLNKTLNMWVHFGENLKFQGFRETHFEISGFY